MNCISDDTDWKNYEETEDEFVCLVSDIPMLNITRRTRAFSASSATANVQSVLHGVALPSVRLQLRFGLTE